MTEPKRISYTEACCIAKETAKRAARLLKEEVDKEAEEYWKENFTDDELKVILRALCFCVETEHYYSEKHKQKTKDLLCKVTKMLG